MKTFLPKFTNFLAMSWRRLLLLPLLLRRTAQPPTNNSEHDICKLCNTCASSRPLAFEAEDQILFKRNFSPGFDVPCWP